MPVVRVEASSDPILYWMIESVPVNAVLWSITAVSWARGKLVSAPVPLDISAQEDEPAQVVLVPTR